MAQLNAIPQNLSCMLKEVNSNDGFKKFIKKTAQKINFQKKNILNLTQEKVESLYRSLKNKLEHAQYEDDVQKNFQNSIWLQNQLRIFIYIMCAHLFLKKISIHELVIQYLSKKQDDYLFLQEFFPSKRSQHLEYQIKLLLSNKNSKWSLEESKLFREIMKQNQELKRWNYIAKQLFIRSNKKYFKTPKQCRQRWINHEDQSKIKGNWVKEEDIILLESVIDFGKKWTLISKELKQTRTQNSVKNRYNSLIKMAKKNYGYEKTQDILIDLLIGQRKNSQIQQQISDGAQIKVENPINVNQKQLVSQKSNLVLTKSIHQQMVAEPYADRQWKMQIEVKSYKIMPIPNPSTNHNDFKYVFQESEQLQNIVWHSSETPFKLEDQFYLMDGSFCFDPKYGI